MSILKQIKMLAPITLLLVGLFAGIVTSDVGVAQSAVVVFDDRGQQIIVAQPVERIVVAGTPLFSEILIDLGVEHLIVGVTDSPDNPAELGNIPSVGSPFTPNIEEIIALEPDIVFGAIFGTRDQLEALGIVVITPLSFVTSVPDIFQIIRDVGLIVDRVVQAEFLIGDISRDVVEIESLVAQEERPRVTFLFASSVDNAPFAVPKGSVEGELIARAGGVNIFPDAPFDAPVSFESIIDRDPEFIFTDPSQIENITGNPLFAGVAAVVNNRVVGVSASSLTSTRVADALRSMAITLHPEVFGQSAGD
jgi:iron complex transport system substrate-binding protein